jgi:hypothetical protein
VNESGTNLSVGQKELLSFARIVILDECTKTKECTFLHFWDVSLETQPLPAKDLQQLLLSF